ncbi:MAG: hypothetical protein KAH22_08475 [Thiotrichaceae bacterium]|nr:hypothetical protein [Thiotrichaceae bacterium]
MIHYFLLFFLTATASSAAPKTEPLIIAEFNKINIGSGAIAALSIEKGQALTKITVNSQPPRQQILIKNYNNTPDYARDIWVADFDFDGYQDIALTSHIDKHNNEPVYRLFTWKPNTKRLVPILFPSPIYNLEHLPKEKIVRSSYLFNKLWTEDSYRFISKQTYLYQRARLVSPNIWHIEQYDIEGNILRHGVSLDAVLNNTTIQCNIITVAAPLYTAPNPTAPIAHTLTMGDQVTLIDFKQNTNNFDWMSVESTVGDQVIHGWVLLSNLLIN